MRRFLRLGQLGHNDWQRRLARYNHVLIPDKKHDRDRLRQQRWVKVLGLGFLAGQTLTREGRALFVLMLPVGLAALDVRYSQVHLLWAMLLGLLVAAWAVRPLFKNHGLSVTVQSARRVAVGQDLHFEVQLSNRGQAPLENLRVLAPFLPWDGRWTTRPAGIARLLAGEQGQVAARARFQARGEHHLDTFDVGSLVLGGLAIGPTTASDGARFLVVPRIADVGDIDLSSPRALGAGALATSLQPGQTDIAGVRPYRTGDELKHLHARTWARTGVPHVRYYFDERQDRVTLAVLTNDLAISERAKEAALSLAAGIAARLALHQGGLDRLITDSQLCHITPRAGEAALDRVLDQLAVVELKKSPSELSALEEALTGTSRAIIVAVRETPELLALVERTRARGVPCAASVVVDARRGRQALALSQVPIHSIEQGRAIRL